MKGTAILYNRKENLTIIENIDRSVYEEIKEQCGCEHCRCKLENKMIDFGSISPILWHEDEVDWEYGY